jgi:Putative adhesin
MSSNLPRGRSAAYRLPGVVALGLLGGGGVYAAHHAERGYHDSSYVLAETAPKVLRLLGGNADVEIVPVAGGSVRIQWRAEWVGRRPSHHVRVRNGVVELAGQCGDGLTHVTGLFAFRVPCSTHYRVEVPAGQAISLSVGSGDVSLSRLSGSIDVSARSGDVSARKMSGVIVRLATKSGDISASFASAPVALTATASSGDVSVRVPGGHYRITAGTSSGDHSIHGLTNDPASRRTIVARAKSGDVSVGRSDG